ncbi:2-oxo acid dehydrogenase subunit E2 [Clostridium tyrobutyricum]|uniref:2-oxo acid dehydrogenase subunit E2 n=1 Tax=Clostridium tyrobutyricum TaxID=1519 RepID=UPI0011CC89D3|nr:2-oxo acid dehydrogenase subunit E2 [Clostridium tyrobutyricum]
MSSLIVMPKLGLTMEEGEIETWHKGEGEEVKKGEILLDVTTDKLTNEVEAKESGVLRKIFAQEGDTVKCLDPVAIIAGKNEDISGLLQEVNIDGDEIQPKETVSPVSDKNEMHEAESVPVKREGRIKISPIAKKIALQNNVDFELITGTGPMGRIVKNDVEQYIESNRIKVSPVARKLAEKLNVDLNKINKDGRIMKEDVLKFAKADEVQIQKLSEIDTSQVGEPINGEKIIKMSPMRKVIAKRMSESVRTSPTVTYNMSVDTSELKRFKNHIKDICKVTYTDLLIKIVSVVLKQFPLVNCSISGDSFILKNYVNMGVAVALDEGLIVPVVKDSDKKGLKELSVEFKELAKKAKENKLGPDDMGGATFTITNLGMYGIDTFSPIINQPEVAILGVNRICETPVVEDGKVIIKPLMNLSLTADHRAIDGAYAAQFLAKIKEYIEKPELLLL